MAPFVERHLSRTTVVFALARLGGRGSWCVVVGLPPRRCTCACRSACLTSRTCHGTPDSERPEGLLSLRRRPSASSCPPCRVLRSQLGKESRVAFACRRSRGEAAGVGSPAPWLWDRCVRVKCPRRLHHSRDTSLPRVSHSTSSASNSHELCCGYDTERVRWPRPKACGSF